MRAIRRPSNHGKVREVEPWEVQSDEVRARMKEDRRRLVLGLPKKLLYDVKRADVRRSNTEGASGNGDLG